MFYNSQGEFINNNYYIESFADIDTNISNPKPKIDEPNSCDNLIKQSYADFDKKYEILRVDYDKKIKEQKDLTDSTMKQFLDEKESWNKNYEEKKKEFEKSIEDEKKKLADLKIMFEDRLKSLDSNIKDISLAIKKI
jgi:hypothetical protein